MLQLCAPDNKIRLLHEYNLHIHVSQLRESSLRITVPFPPATPGYEVGTGAQDRNSRHFAAEVPCAELIKLGLK